MRATYITSAVGLLASLTDVEQWLRITVLILPLVVACVQVCARVRKRMKHKRHRRVVMISLSGLLVLLLQGCVTPSNLPQVIHELGQNTNTVSVSVRSPWGTIEFRRN